MKKIQILLIVLIFSIFAIFWIEFEILPLIKTNYNSCSKINNLIVIISLSYISSFIFYYIVVYMKEKKDKNNSKIFVSRKINEIIKKGENLRKIIEETDNVHFSKFVPEKDILLSKLHTIRFTDTVKEKRIIPITWEKLMAEHTSNIRIDIDRLFVLLPYLETNFISKLNELYDCQLFIIFHNLAPVNLIEKEIRKYNVPNFRVTLVEPLIDYFSLIDELKKTKPM